MEEIISLNTFVLFVCFFVALPEDMESLGEGKTSHYVSWVIDGIVSWLSEREKDLRNEKFVNGNRKCIFGLI
jgi:hypothetical protein